MNLPAFAQRAADLVRPDLAARRRSIEEARDKQEAEGMRLAVQRYEDIRWLMSSPNGRRIVYRLLEQCGFQASGWSKDAAEVHFLQGRRSVATELAAEVATVSAEGYLDMLREAMDAPRA